MKMKIGHKLNKVTDLKIKYEVNKIKIELDYKEALDLRTSLRDYVDNVEEYDEDAMETTKNLLEKLDNMN